MNVEGLKVPQALTVPDALKYIRNNVLDVIREYGITKAGIRITEYTEFRLNRERLQIEGVLQEAFASSNLDSYYLGQVVSISSRVGLEKGEFAKCIEGSSTFRSIGNWMSHSKAQREAIICAVGAENA